ncbi:MAG: NapD protein [Pseudomonadota bacterium]|jgi:nitrate reductase NapAB chaperone NapD
MQPALIHITSFIVLAQPEHAESLAHHINQKQFFKIAMQDLTLGKLILIAESDNLPLIENETNQLRDFHGVQAVTLVYHQAANTDELMESIL